MSVNLLALGDAWLTARRHESATVSVVYATQSGQVTLAATLGTANDSAVLADGAVIQWENPDFLIRAIDLKINGTATEPQPGHKITLVQNGTTYYHEVVKSDTQPCWVWSDLSKTTMRVHTQRVQA